MAELSGRLALLVFAAALAGLIGWSAAHAQSVTEIANNPAAFDKARSDLERKDQAKQKMRQEVQAAQAPKRKPPQQGGCVVKSVMTDADLDACRRRR